MTFLAIVTKTGNGYHYSIYNSCLPHPFVGMHVYGTGVFSIASPCTPKSAFHIPLFVIKFKVVL